MPSSANPGRFVWGMPGHGEETRYAWDRPEVHEIYRRWRRLLDSYPVDRMAVGEVYLADTAARARYVRPDGLNLAFNFGLLWASWEAAALRAAVEAALAENAAVNATTTWVLSSHDAIRHLTRYGGGEVGRRRARAAALLLLALPGPAYVDQGEELGLPEAVVPDEAIQDPLHERSGGRERGRDGARVPLPWYGAAPPYGFCPDGVRPWLPMPADWAPLTVDAQNRDPHSMLALYRAALACRTATRALRAGTGLRWLDGDPDCLVFERTDAGGDMLVCAVNVGSRPMRRPPHEVLVASEPAIGDTLPAEAAVWVR